jgi:ankyrin repeat protein
MVLLLTLAFALSLFAICGYRSAANTAQLHEAIAHFDMPRLRSLLEQGYDVNQLNKGDVFGIRIRSYPLPYDSDVTPIYVAAGESNVDAVRLLIKNGANPNLECGGYGSPLRLAVMQLAPSINLVQPDFACAGIGNMCHWFASASEGICLK